MKKAILLVVLIFIGFGSLAQSNSAPVKAGESKVIGERPLSLPINAAKESTETIIWSEDFSNGIPASWTNTGNVPASKWEYRGLATTPSNATGSRGAYAGTTGPIQSPTTANGFVIFDSDYLDNGGSTTGGGQGPAPAPHWGALIIPAMDLTAYPQINLEFYQFFRQFSSITQVMFSRDGGVTWPDTITVNATTPAANEATPNNAFISFDVSQQIGGEANAAIRFQFSAVPDSANDGGYYFWQIDDIALVENL